MTKSLAAALLISTATFAHAQNVVATGAEPDEPAPRHADGRIGLLVVTATACHRNRDDSLFRSRDLEAP